MEMDDSSIAGDCGLTNESFLDGGHRNDAFLDGGHRNEAFLDGGHMKVFFLDGAAIDKLNFDANGLIPAIVQDYHTGEALTLAYMNRESLDISMREKRTCFFSRSRQKLWRKGETSGNTQDIISITADCEYNSLLVKVAPNGPACHTGDTSCFRNRLYAAGCAQSAGATQAVDATQPTSAGTTQAVDAAQATSADATQAVGTTQATSADASQADFSIDSLYRLIEARKAERPEGSYTTYLFDKGLEKILKKVGEESAEVIIAAMKQNRGELVFEAADLCYHMLVLLCEAGIEPSCILGELRGRHIKTGDTV